MTLGLWLALSLMRWEEALGPCPEESSAEQKCPKSRCTGWSATGLGLGTKNSPVQGIKVWVALL